MLDDIAYYIQHYILDHKLYIICAILHYTASVLLPQCYKRLPSSLPGARAAAVPDKFYSQGPLSGVASGFRV